MIKINNPNIAAISLTYYNDIKADCIQRAEFFMVVLNFLFHGAPRTDITGFTLHAKTKRKLINVLIGTHKIKKNLDFTLFTGADAYAWVRNHQAEINTMLTDLSTDLFLKDLILKPAQQCYPYDGYLHTLYNMLMPTKKKQFSRIAYNVLDYQGIFHKYAYALSASLAHHTCAYCNRIYTNTVVAGTGKDKRGIRPAFDHFYPHSHHPFLSLSFFNLIPSCYYCNSSLKSSTKTTPQTHLHPYIEGFGKACTFNFDLIGNYPDVSDPRNYKVKLDMNIPTTDSRYNQIRGRAGGGAKEGNINLFLLEEIYDEHRELVGELRLKAKKYNSVQGQSLKKLLGLLKSSKSEFYQFYFGNYFRQDDHHKRPMAKLTKDIISRLVPDFK